MSTRSQKKVKNSKRTAKSGLPPRPAGIRIRDVPSKANPTPVSSTPVEDDMDVSLEELFLEDALTENRLVWIDMIISYSVFYLFIYLFLAMSQTCCSTSHRMCVFSLSDLSQVNAI